MEKCFSERLGRKLERNYSRTPPPRLEGSSRKEKSTVRVRKEGNMSIDKIVSVIRSRDSREINIFYTFRVVRWQQNAGEKGFNNDKGNML